MSRLHETLGRPELAWLVDRLHAGLSRGRDIPRRLSLRNPSEAQRNALNRLVGKFHTGSSLTVDTGELEALLRSAGLAHDLREAVETLRGPVVDRAALEEASRRAWLGVFETARAQLPADLVPWLSELESTGLVRRLCGGDPAQGAQLLSQAVEVSRRLPARGVALAELAAEVCGDAHGLDAGRPLGSLCIRLAARLGGWDDWRGSRRRQLVWTSVGVLVDELSASALVLNLRAGGGSLTARLLDLCAEAGEPLRLSLRQLLKDEASFCHQTVHICENPTILGAAAERLGSACAPLVCIEGKPSTAAQVLLDRLAGGRLLYHGDFDWPGLAIANTVMERHGALPWRFASADYLALDRGLPLEGTPVEPSWDPDLGRHMQARGLAVHEEQVSETLLSDLA